MKLIRCKKCEDVVRLVHTEWRQCDCKKSGGQYNDDMVTATIGGDCEVIGLRNDYFAAKPFSKTRDKSDDNGALNDIIQGEYEGDVQIHRILSGDGPKLEMDIEEIDNKTFRLVFTDKRKYSINLKGDKSPKYVDIVDGERGSSFKDKETRNEGTKSLVKNLLREYFIIEAIKSTHWVKDSYPNRIETSTLKDMDPSHRQEIDKRLNFIESLEFSDKQPQKIGVWIYKTPKPVLHEPFTPRYKGPLLLAIVNNNNMTTLYWKHKFEGQYDYDITYRELVEFVASDFYDAQSNPITINNLQAFNKSKKVVEPVEPRTDRFKKIKLSNGKIVRYYEALTKFETLEGQPIDNYDILDELPEELQDKVLSSME